VLLLLVGSLLVWEHAMDLLAWGMEEAWLPEAARLAATAAAEGTAWTL
jgi:hypothetical protein